MNVVNFVKGNIRRWLMIEALDKSLENSDFLELFVTSYCVSDDKLLEHVCQFSNVA